MDDENLPSLQHLYTLLDSKTITDDEKALLQDMICERKQHGDWEMVKSSRRPRRRPADKDKDPES